jgi:hypothetical protein
VEPIYWIDKDLWKPKLLGILTNVEYIPMITQTDIDNWFSYHSPQGDQPERYIRIREAARHLAEVILENSKPSADQTAAIRKVREAVMTANAGIACEQ